MRRIIDRFSTLSLQNKFFISILAVIMIISGTIALLARWILVSSLTTELELRGTAIAHSVAARGAGYILDNDKPQLLNLIFDEAQLRERQQLVAYIFVQDNENTVLGHTLVRPLPDKLTQANPLAEGEQRSVKVVSVHNEPAYDIAVPIYEGLYRIGTVHVGLSKDHIDSLVGKLRITFLGFISAVIIIIFLISHRLSQYITAPVVQLTRISDDLSRGNFQSAGTLDGGDSGWTIQDCPAYDDTDLPCWHFDEQLKSSSRLDSLHRCKKCLFYRKRKGDEVLQLTDSFRNMVWSIKLYRQRLQESEGKYRSLFNSGPDPIFVVDCTNQAILDANPRAEEVYGYSHGELKGISFLEVGPDPNRECLAVFDEGGDIQTSTGCLYYNKVVHYRKGRQPFYVNMHACPIGYRGRPAIIVATTDITDMMEKDAQLVQASKMKSLGEMSAGVAHELNQPLNAIRMGSDYLTMLVSPDSPMAPLPHEAKEAQIQEVLDEINVQVDRATEIITTLRSFSRKADFLAAPIDINAPVKAVVSLALRQFQLQNVNIKLDLQENPPLVLAHDNRLQQVFFNLISNSRDAIIERQRSQQRPTSGIITISSRTAEDQVVLSFSDNGCGFSDSIRDKVFEPFFTTKVTGQGMGLGLAISYGIVRDYGGQIRTESKAGEGTTFHLSFPVHATDAVRQAANTQNGQNSASA
ncbi:ATP-binding protein [Oleidesulfovibrio sp.]|uniref:ATP-binding protein n=1 Tax=Oleidesulfovibrio sp. TaxID=2909707 RepID=UPI003A88C043